MCVKYIYSLSYWETTRILKKKIKIQIHVQGIQHYQHKYVEVHVDISF